MSEEPETEHSEIDVPAKEKGEKGKSKGKKEKGKKGKGKKEVTKDVQEEKPAAVPSEATIPRESILKSKSKSQQSETAIPGEGDEGSGEGDEQEIKQTKSVRITASGTRVKSRTAVKDKSSTSIKDKSSTSINKGASNVSMSSSRMKIIQEKLSKSAVAIAEKSQSKIDAGSETNLEGGSEIKLDIKEKQEEGPVAEEGPEAEGKSKEKKGKGKKGKGDKKKKKEEMKEKEKEKEKETRESVESGGEDDTGEVKKKVKIQRSAKDLDTQRSKDIFTIESQTATKTMKSLQRIQSTHSPSSSSSGSSEHHSYTKKKKTSTLMSTEDKGKKKKKKHFGKDSKTKILRIDETDEERVEKVFDPSSTSVIPMGEEEEQQETEIKPKKAKKAKKGKGKGKKKKETGKKQKEKVKEPFVSEEEALRLAEEEKQKARGEKKDAIAKEKKELQEGVLRGEKLDITIALKAASEEAHRNIINEEQVAEEWRQYLVCDGLPAPWDVPGMNTYLHLWEKEIETVTAERCKERTAEAINLLEKLEDIIDEPFDTTERRYNDWKWVAGLFREHQDKNLEFCTYRLLRDIKTNLQRININSADYRFEENLLSMCLYVVVTLPTPIPSFRSVSKNKIALKWPEISSEIVFPPTLKAEFLGIRGMYLKYDHFSDTTPSYECPELPAFYLKDLKTACHEQLIFKQRYKYDKREIIPPKVEEGAEEGAEPPPPEEEIPYDEMPPTVPYQKLDPSASTVLLETLNSEMIISLYSLSLENLPDHLVNLRQFVILGGVFCLDLFYQPPQPQGMVSFEVSLSTLIEPFELQRAPFVLRREVTEVFDLRPIRTKMELKSQYTRIFEPDESDFVEKELEELIDITIKLPKHVYLLNNPMVVQWEEDFNSWSTMNIFNSNYTEGSDTIQFKTNQFRPVAIATYKWSNLPFRNWEIRPEQDGTVTLLLTAAILFIEFNIKGITVCVKTIQNAPNEAFEQHLGNYYRFPKLMKLMKNTGIDVFPFFDTFLYVEGACNKFWAMEDHLYFCMAYISTCHNIIWSKWNSTLDSYSIVFLMRLLRYDRHKITEFDTILVQPTRCLGVCCNEESEQFSDEPMEGMRFFADLWHMTASTSTKAVKTLIAHADQAQVRTLYHLFKNIRFISFSSASTTSAQV